MTNLLVLKYSNAFLTNRKHYIIIKEFTPFEYLFLQMSS